MPIYTKKGDKGETGLFGTKDRYSKDSNIYSAIGNIDELNSYLGVCISVSESVSINNVLINIQNDLLTIGSILAGSDKKFSAYKTKKLETVIDRLDKEIPELKNFVLPGGTALSSHLHFARSLSRRAERGVVRLNKENMVKPQILVYLNRLSDLFFTLARYANHQVGREDEIWK
jgi:cob(I)alamin adenosyltransferase